MSIKNQILEEYINESWESLKTDFKTKKQAKISLSSRKLKNNFTLEKRLMSSLQSCSQSHCSPIHTQAYQELNSLGIQFHKILEIASWIREEANDPSTPTITSNDLNQAIVLLDFYFFIENKEQYITYRNLNQNNIKEQIEKRNQIIKFYKELSLYENSELENLKINNPIIFKQLFENYQVPISKNDPAVMKGQIDFVTYQQEQENTRKEMIFIKMKKQVEEKKRQQEKEMKEKKRQQEEEMKQIKTILDKNSTNSITPSNDLKEHILNLLIETFQLENRSQEVDIDSLEKQQWIKSSFSTDFKNQYQIKDIMKQVESKSEQFKLQLYFGNPSTLLTRLQEDLLVNENPKLIGKLAKKYNIDKKLFIRYTKEFVKKSQYNNPSEALTTIHCMVLYQKQPLTKEKRDRFINLNNLSIEAMKKTEDGYNNPLKNDQSSFGIHTHFQQGKTGQNKKA